MSEYKRPTVASLLSRRLHCWRAASQQLIDPATLADAKLEFTLTNENNKKLHYLIADLSSHVKIALPCELTRQNRHVHASLPRRRTTTRSPTVRLNSKLFKATLTSRTEKIRPQNIRLNSCSFTLVERSDSDDMVRQKNSKKQRKSLAGDGRDADVVATVRDRGVCGPHGQEICMATCVGLLRYSMATIRKVKGRVLTTWSEEESLPWNVVGRHSFGKKSRQECRTVLKLGRNIFGLSTHHSNVKNKKSLCKYFCYFLPPFLT